MGHATAFGQGKDEQALRLLVPTVAPLAQARDGGEVDDALGIRIDQPALRGVERIGVAGGGLLRIVVGEMRVERRFGGKGRVAHR